MKINNYFTLFICILFTWNIDCLKHSCVNINIKMALKNTPESLYQKLADSLLQRPTTIITHHQQIQGQQIREQEVDLSTIEWKNINYILNHRNSSPELRVKVKNIIYNCYEKWAFSMVHLIRNKHQEKCGPIQVDELKLYGYIGLRKAIINYDSTKYNQFTNYAVKYIYNEVFNGIYELSPIYACDGDYQYVKKQKIIHKMNYKYKRNGTRRQKPILNNIDNENNNILRKKIAMEME